MPIQLPIGSEDTFKGIIDLVEMDADIYYDEMGKDMRVEPIPADMVDLANEYHEKLLDAVSMFDDSIMEDYLEGKEIDQKRIRKAIRMATIENEMVPVVCGTSYRNKGVQKLLDAIVDYMPAPDDVPAIKGTNPKTDEEEDRHPSDDEPFSALAFKIMTDPYVGRLSFFRVYSGHLTTGSSVLNSVKNQKERMGRILQMHANHREDIEEVWAGDIAAAVGLKNTTTGDTLCDEKAPVILESMDFPEPVIRVAIEPKTKAGQEKMGLALVKLAEEDPTFKTYTDEETGQTIIAGMGELHLEIIVDRLLREFKVEANVGAPQVAYKETVRKKVDQDTKYKRQSGGSGQYGHVKITVEPNESGKGYEFVNAVVGGSIPKEFIPAVDAGIQGALQSGVVAGFPVVDVKVTLYDGSYHEVDSSEMAFKIAGSMAFKEAMRQGGSRPAGAHHEGLRHCARRVSGHRHRRPDLPPRPDSGSGGPSRRAAGGRTGASGQYVRLCHRPAFQHPGPRSVHHGASQLRRDSQEHPRQDRGGAGQEGRLIRVLLFTAGYCKINGAMKRAVHKQTIYELTGGFSNG